MISSQRCAWQRSLPENPVPTRSPCSPACAPSRVWDVAKGELVCRLAHQGNDWVYGTAVVSGGEEVLTTDANRIK